MKVLRWWLTGQSVKGAAGSPLTMTHAQCGSRGADPALLTSDKMAAAAVLAEARATEPGQTVTADQQAKDASLQTWLQRRAAGENIPLTYGGYGACTEEEKPAGARTCSMWQSRCVVCGSDTCSDTHDT